MMIMIITRSSINILKKGNNRYYKAASVDKQGLQVNPTIFEREKAIAIITEKYDVAKRRWYGHCYLADITFSSRIPIFKVNDNESENISRSERFWNTIHEQACCSCFDVSSSSRRFPKIQTSGCHGSIFFFW